MLLMNKDKLFDCIKRNEISFILIAINYIVYDSELEYKQLYSNDKGLEISYNECDKIIFKNGDIIYKKNNLKDEILISKVIKRDHVIEFIYNNEHYSIFFKSNTKHSEIYNFSKKAINLHKIDDEIINILFNIEIKINETIDKLCKQGGAFLSISSRFSKIINNFASKNRIKLTKEAEKIYSYNIKKIYENLITIDPQSSILWKNHEGRISMPDLLIIGKPYRNLDLIINKKELDDYIIINFSDKGEMNYVYKLSKECFSQNEYSLILSELYEFYNEFILNSKKALDGQQDIESLKFILDLINFKEINFELGDIEIYKKNTIDKSNK